MEEKATSCSEEKKMSFMSSRVLGRQRGNAHCGLMSWDNASASAVGEPTKGGS